MKGGLTSGFAALELWMGEKGQYTLVLFAPLIPLVLTHNLDTQSILDFGSAELLA